MEGEPWLDVPISCGDVDFFSDCCFLVFVLFVCLYASIPYQHCGVGVFLKFLVCTVTNGCLPYLIRSGELEMVMVCLSGLLGAVVLYCAS